MATQSYRERMKAQRAAAGAKREAEQAEWHRRAELRYEVRRLAMDAVKAGITARGDKLSLYSHDQLLEQANAIIGPWLVAQAKAQIAEDGRSISGSRNVAQRRAASQVRTVAALRDMSHRTTALGDFCADWASNRYEHPRSTDSNHRSLRIRHSHHNPRRSPYTHPLRSHGRSHAPHTHGHSRVRHHRLRIHAHHHRTHGRQQTVRQDDGHFPCQRHRRLTG